MSLRRQLTWGLAVVLAVGGIAAATIGAWNTRREVNYLLDNQLIRIAQLAAYADPPPMTKLRDGKPLHRRRGVPDNEILVQRWSGDTSISLVPGRPRLPRPQRDGFWNFEARGADWRMYALPIADGWVAAAQPMEGRHELVGSAALTAAMPALACLPVVGFLVAWTVRRTLQPLQRVAADVEERAPLSSQPLDARGVPQEILPLVSAFNGLLARVSRSVERERHFIIDAAHALRTPVAVLQLQAESLQEAKSAAAAAERLEDLLSGIARARRTVEQLLELARSEHGSRGRAQPAIVLAALGETFAPILERKRISLQLDIGAVESAIVPLAPEALAVVMHNVLDNALRYSPSGARISVDARRTERGVRLQVSDCGPGLPTSELDQVFGRFNRAANDATAGTGLGLAIVRAIVESAGGKVWLEPATGSSTGLTVVIELPTLSSIS